MAKLSPVLLQAFFKTGFSDSAIAAIVHSTPHVIRMRRLYQLKRKGDVSVSHPEKALMARKLLEGKRNLSIYESCAFLDDGKEGRMTKEYRKYGTVTPHRKSEGAREEVLRKALVAGELYDVVDDDSYGDALVMMMAGLPKLVKDHGILLLTFCRGNHYARWPNLRNRLFCLAGVSDPAALTIQDLVAACIRLSAVHCRRLELLDTQTFPEIYRLAFKVSKFNWKSSKDINQLLSKDK